MPKKPYLPTANELNALPRWGRVALAGRWSRRVRPLFDAWRQAPPEHREAVAWAISMVESAAKVGAAPRIDEVISADECAMRASSAADLRADSGVHIWDHDGVYKPMLLAAAAAARCAALACFVINDSSASHLVKLMNNATEAVGLPQLRIAKAMRADFDRLRASADAEKWTSASLIPDDVFGPMWPEGAPEGWPDRCSAAKNSALEPGKSSAYTTENRKPSRLRRAVRRIWKLIGDLVSRLWCSTVESAIKGQTNAVLDKLDP